jgi:hypothetical protein
MVGSLRLQQSLSALRVHVQQETKLAVVARGILMIPHLVDVLLCNQTVLSLTYLCACFLADP